MPYVYLLKSLKDKNGYIGSTINLDDRVIKHNKGYVSSTKNRRPFILKGYQEFDNIKQAALYEKKYKRSHEALERAIKKGEFKIINFGA